MGEKQEIEPCPWCGEPDRHRTCAKCSRIKKRAFALGAGDEEDCGIIFGELWETLRELLRGDGARRREEIRHARR